MHAQMGGQMPQMAPRMGMPGTPGMHPHQGITGMPSHGGMHPHFSSGMQL